MADGSITAPIKTCTKCHVSKEATRENFSPLKKGIFGLHTWCKACGAAYRREFRANRPDRVAESKARYDAKPEKRAAKIARSRAYWEANKERLRQCQSEYWQANGAELNARKRRLSAEDPTYRAQRQATQKRWLEQNAERAKQVRKEWWSRQPPSKKLRTYIGNAIRESLQGRRKGVGWQKLLGYSVSELRRHLERQFVKGMTWENYGPVWHVDHILPVASFKIEHAGCQEFMACWALANLRPLFAEKNLEKRAQRIHLV